MLTLPRLCSVLGTIARTYGNRGVFAAALNEFSPPHSKHDRGHLHCKRKFFSFCSDIDTHNLVWLSIIVIAKSFHLLILRCSFHWLFSSFISFSVATLLLLLDSIKIVLWHACSGSIKKLECDSVPSISIQMHPATLSDLISLIIDSHKIKKIIKKTLLFSFIFQPSPSAYTLASFGSFRKIPLFIAHYSSAPFGASEESFNWLSAQKKLKAHSQFDVPPLFCVWRCGNWC